MVHTNVTATAVISFCSDLLKGYGSYLFDMMVTSYRFQSGWLHKFTRKRRKEEEEKDES